jgi:hypothetical protein
VHSHCRETQSAKLRPMRFFLPPLLLFASSYLVVGARDVVQQETPLEASLRQIFLDVASGAGGVQGMMDDRGKGRHGADTVREPGRCSMYDTCGKKGGIFGQELPCADNSAAPVVSVVERLVS